MFDWFNRPSYPLQYMQEPAPVYKYTEIFRRTPRDVPRATKRKNKNGLRSYSRRVGRRLVKTYLPIDVGVERRGRTV